MSQSWKRFNLVIDEEPLDNACHVWSKIIMVKYGCGQALKDGRGAVLVARSNVRIWPLEIVGSSGHEKVPMREKPGLERPGRPRRERIEGSAANTCDPTVPSSTIRADVGVAIVPQTVSRHLAVANLKFKCPFR
ncbi:hypothetical protein TNCV_3066261 [Trichonephila clavipes]|uniref:Uncharacterized protein n=1 Tax=Trichonephila clavipes TaxID=2585209 RepID=A0A8X6V999_TRICX|nr:hypothetical protein TNCV_3066261 [Trichonephila clavipes]